MMDWCRLWHDMPTDPVWRVIARRSGCSVAEVLAVYVYMLTTASSASRRGRLEGWDDEVVAAALDMEVHQVTVIFDAMLGELHDGEFVARWKGRPTFSPQARVTSEWLRLRSIVFDRDGYACTYCGEEAADLECDHITPVSRGGSNALENLTTACRACNRSKGAKTIAEWRA